MLDFFKGWRRKVGALTLVMACVFAMGWVRSRHIEDRLLMRPTKSTLVLLKTNDSGYLFVVAHNSEEHIRQFVPGWTCRNAPHFHSEGLPEDDLDFSDGSWHIWKCGFLIGESDDYSHLGISSPAKFCIIPKWSIIIPLTLLSAYLLLTKSRPATRVLPESQSPPPTTPKPANKSTK